MVELYGMDLSRIVYFALHILKDFLLHVILHLDTAFGPSVYGPPLVQPPRKLPIIAHTLINMRVHFHCTARYQTGNQLFRYSFGVLCVSFPDNTLFVSLPLCELSSPRVPHVYRGSIPLLRRTVSFEHDVLSTVLPVVCLAIHEDGIRALGVQLKASLRPFAEEGYAVVAGLFGEVCIPVLMFCEIDRDAVVVLVLLLNGYIAKCELFATTDVARQEAACVGGRQDGWCIVWKNKWLLGVEELMRIGFAPVLFGIHDILVPLGRW